MRDVLVRELADQFRRQWSTLRESVNAVPDDQWRAGEHIHLVPARLAYHIFGGTEVYARSTSYEEFRRDRVFGGDWQVMGAEELPDRAAALRHIDALEKAVERWLSSLEDEGLLTTNDGFPWTGEKKLGRALYLLRHTQSHMGEMNAELRRRGLPRGKWR